MAFIVAIDGPAGSGKGTITKLVGKELNLINIDTGAMYRCVTLECLRRNIDVTDLASIEKVFKKQCDMQELFDRLYKKLQAAEAYNLAFFDQKHIYVPCSFDFVVKSNLNYLIETHTNRLTHQIEDNKEKLEVLQIIEKLKKTNNWKAIFDLSYDEAVNFLQTTFICSIDIAQAVLRKPISYLTREHHQEIVDLQQIINDLEADQSDIFEMLMKKYKSLKTKILKKISKNVTIFKTL